MGINGNFGDNFGITPTKEIKTKGDKKETMAYFAFDNGLVGARLNSLPNTEKEIVVSVFVSKTSDEINNILENGDFSECRELLKSKVNELNLNLKIK